MAPGVTRWVVVLVAAAAAAGLIACGGDSGGDAPKGQVVRFQKPTAPGPDPFTKVADVRGPDTVKPETGSGPYGGTGSDRVCDRELLIRSLIARPDRLRAWAQTLHIAPTAAAVSAYIRNLRPVTLTRDTRVTNHSFVDGRATGYQAILQAGTAVLVDERGIPRARCRCGNPLLEPVYIAEATCVGCPPNYTPPPPCEPWTECYTPYPNPPPVEATGATTPGATTPTEPNAQPPPQALNPQASISPGSGPPDTFFTLSVSGFPPNQTLPVRVVRPSGTVDDFSLTTGSDGSGTLGFPADPNREVGGYTVTATDPASGASASASVTVTAAATDQAAPDTTTGQDTTSQEELPVCDPVQPVQPCRQE